MKVNKEGYEQLQKELEVKEVTLVAVSKTKPVEDIQELYELGQRDFGENYVQELVEKASQLPKDIRWHFIGHLQTNKVKLIVPLVQLIHGVDSLKLLKEINKEAAKCGKVVDCLLQIHIAQEETKFGLNEAEVEEIMSQYANMQMNNVRITGLMGMASFTDDENKIRSEFKKLKEIYTRYAILENLSIGMSSDYKIAVEEGSTMVRIGSLLFGERQKSN
jgi:PLP dependent protein